MVYDPPVPAHPQSSSAVSQSASSNAAGLPAGAGQDSFVFTPMSGHETATMDAGQTGPLASWNAAAFSLDTDHGAPGYPFTTDYAHDALLGGPLAEAQFHTHLGDFHIV